MGVGTLANDTRIARSRVQVESAEDALFSIC